MDEQNEIMGDAHEEIEAFEDSPAEKPLTDEELDEWFRRFQENDS
jgi:hypothetical protein